MTRLSVDLAAPSRPGYEMEVLYPDSGVLSRQDDRYHTVPYGVGFMMTLDATRPMGPAAGGQRDAAASTAGRGSTTRDAERRRTSPGSESSVQECCFVPRHARAAEGDGYLLGVVNRWDEGRNDLLVLDALHLDEGPLAIVRMPTRIHPQVHGCWVPADERNAV